MSTQLTSPPRGMERNPEAKKYEGPDLYVGQDCVYYEHADKSSEPMGAKVIKTNGRGVLSLLISTMGGAAVGKRNVRHVDCEDLKKDPSIARSYGGWDFLKIHPSTPSDARVPNHMVGWERRLQIIESQIADLTDLFGRLNPDRVKNLVTQQELTQLETRVNELRLEINGLTDPAPAKESKAAKNAANSK